MRQDLRANSGSTIDNLIQELEHLRGWDMLDACGDGECKKEQIDICIKYAKEIKENGVCGKNVKITYTTI
jgi:hypothetical protein